MQDNQFFDESYKNIGQQQQFQTKKQLQQKNFHQVGIDNLSKKAYYQQLKKHNKELCYKIKTLNQELSDKVNKLIKKNMLNKKIYTPTSNKNLELDSKFSYLQKLNRKIHKSQLYEESLAYYTETKKKLIDEINVLNSQIKQDKNTLAFLKTKIKHSQCSVQIPPISPQQIYFSQVQAIKKQIKTQRQRVKKNRDQFLQKNRNNSIFNQKRRNKSVLSIKQGQNQQNDSQLVKLKNEYQILGRRIEILKLKKAMLSKNNIIIQEKKKLLLQLKIKYQQLSKIPRQNDISQN